MSTEPTVTGEGLRQLFERGSGTPEQAWAGLASFFNASFLHAGKDGLGIHAFAERLMICAFLRKMAEEQLCPEPDTRLKRDREAARRKSLCLAAGRIQAAEHHHVLAKKRTDS